MAATPVSVGTQAVLEPEALALLIPSLQQRGYQVVGPTIRDGAIVYDRLDSLQDLPVGWTDDQEAGRYRLKRREDGALFGYTVGPHSWKKFLHPPEVRLFQAERKDSEFQILAPSESPPRYAFFGVRGCELAALAVQDRVFLGDRYTDPLYQARRQGAFIVAVNCSQASSTCFCTSMQTGPRVQAGFDLCLTELIGQGFHRFVIEVGSQAGAEVLTELEYSEATPEARQEVEATVERTASMIQRRMDTTGIRDLLMNNLEHPRWDQVAARCLTCANCTMVCPTCFCTTVEDVTDLTGKHAERWRRWDSCFSTDFSYIHGGSVRSSAKSRYRQWMTHKLATWIDQFGTSGCVGCGRCITWCPVGIDLTEEVHAIRQNGSEAAATRAKERNHEDA